MHRRSLILICCALSGCVLVETSVTNPVPGMRTVAVAPFINHSAEPASVVDGRRFAMAYFAELQKVPGFEVVPVGVTETAMAQNNLQLGSREAALRLAKILDVDAVVVGAVTDYDPYYPPRIGLKVEWLSPYPWMFRPGVAVDPGVRRHLIDAEWHRSKEIPEAGRATELALPGTLRAQSPEPSRPVDAGVAGRQELPMPGLPPLPLEVSEQEGPSVSSSNPGSSEQPGFSLPGSAADVEQQRAGGFDPNRPLMAYARIFDGTEADLLANLRDYVELNGDLRGGGWEAYLHRSEDFIRFAAHRMIVEMLTLHGGEGGRRIIFKWRKHK